MTKTILYYEWKIFFRSKGMLFSTLLMVLTGVYAIYYSRSFHETQLKTIHYLDTAFQNRVQTQMRNFKADTSTEEGKQRYANAHNPFMNEWFTRPMIWKIPQPLQALSIGQSDNQPFYFGLWVYNDNIYTNKKVELRNPDKLQAGNFDLSFVIIYLLPLLAISFSYNIYSSDRERGTTALLTAYGISLHQIIFGRLLFRWLVIAGINILLTAAAFFINRIDSARLFAAWTLVSTLYVFFWFGLIYLVVVLRKNSSLSALFLISNWIILLFIVPAFLNGTRIPHDAERVELSDAEREFGIHLWHLWQNGSAHLLDTLYQVQPQLEQYAIRDTEDLRSVAYSYLRILYLNEKGWRADSLSYGLQAQQLSNRPTNPAFTAQYAFNQLAGSETDQFILFRKAAADYHRERTAYLNDLRISGKPFTLEVFSAYPVFNPPENPITWKRLIYLTWPIIVLFVICSAAGWLIARQRQFNSPIMFKI